MKFQSHKYPNIIDEDADTESRKQSYNNRWREREENRKQCNIFNKEIPQIIMGDRRVQNSGKLTDRTANGEGHDATKTVWES